jgi:hypothetical protein
MGESTGWSALLAWDDVLFKIIDYTVYAQCHVLHIGTWSFIPFTFTDYSVSPWFYMQTTMVQNISCLYTRSGCININYSYWWQRSIHVLDYYICRGNAKVFLHCSYLNCFFFHSGWSWIFGARCFSVPHNWFCWCFLRGKNPLGDISFGRLPIWVSLIFIAGKLTRAGSKFAAVWP